jgi:hypothetical protein
MDNLGYEGHLWGQIRIRHEQIFSDSNDGGWVQR